MGIKKSRFGITLLVLLVAFVSASQAFPLTGGNGIVNATVYGVTEREAPYDL